ncbi:MAG: sulfurtransferase TusA [Pseudomonadota bacterium]|jgi:tRNA 2-thiouridine synthesizing protein A
MNSDNPPADDIRLLDVMVELDATGLYCPEPVMLLHNHIRDLAAGELLRVIATDPSTTRDIPKFCLFLGHELVGELQQDGRYYYLIRKKQD